MLRPFFADAVLLFDATSELTQPTDFGILFLKMLVSLVLLIALMLMTVWALRRLIQHRLQRGNDMQAIQVLEKRMLSPKTTLYLVEIDKKKVLVAESHLEIKQLATLEEHGE
ncbi:MAG: hypothetical protein RL235_480 [Chlamydiota bacterium]|jgi:flagellar protein FliO/FliZ